MTLNAAGTDAWIARNQGDPVINRWLSDPNIKSGIQVIDANGQTVTLTQNAAGSVVVDVQVATVDNIAPIVDTYSIPGQEIPWGLIVAGVGVLLLLSQRRK